MGFQTTFNAVFNAVKALLVADSTFKDVQLGTQFRLGKLPLCYISPGETTVSPAGRVGCKNFQLEMTFEVYVLVRETEPTDIVGEVQTPLSAVLDIIYANPTLSGTVEDCMPVFHSPGEIRTPDKLYYGGVVRCVARLFYSPA